MLPCVVGKVWIVAIDHIGRNLSGRGAPIAFVVSSLSFNTNKGTWNVRVVSMCRIWFYGSG
jgi:hypothetical protein